MGEPISQNDPRWDAHTLAEAEVIKADKSRLAAAQLAAGQMQKEAEIKAKSLEGVRGNILDHPSSVKAREERKKRVQRELINTLKE